MNTIELKNVCVDFRVPRTSNQLTQIEQQSSQTSASRLTEGRRAVLVRALDNINLELENGERLGLIGRNGSGKTTLLRVIAGILPPTQGSVKVVGSISSLLSIQLGFDDRATGYENILSRASFMGITRARALEQLDEIIEFAELDEFIHLPTSTYSSGMRMRLAFGVATAFQPDVLVMDEWLSAGDEVFRTKAKSRLIELIERSSVYVLASHDQKLLRDYCSRVAVVFHGKILHIGPVEEALEFYREGVAAGKL